MKYEFKNQRFKYSYDIRCNSAAVNAATDSFWIISQLHAVGLLPFQSINIEIV